MFRFLSLPVIALSIVGCVDKSITPGTLPEGATSGVYTTADAQTVASCIATAIGGTVQPVGDRLIIASVRDPGLSYSVGPNKRNIVYPTQVAITGTEVDTSDAKGVDECVVARKPAQ